MKKTIILAAFAALVLAGCAKNDVYTATEGTPLTFGVYNGNAVTKAVSATTYDTIDNNVLGNSAGKGFGVFGYYTDNANYSRNTIANFMYNEQVKGDGNGTAAATAWTYAPIKYWPNEHGLSATSTGTDKLTFLCYAPWVETLVIGDVSSTVKDADGNAATEGITAMTGNNAASDAVLTFKVPASSKNQIDLLYGVLNEKSTNVDGTEEGTVDSAIENLTKEKTGGKVSIKFKHALAKVAINIKDVVDQVSPNSSVDPDAGEDKQTKVVVESLKLTGSNLSKDGNLNLYTGEWSDFTTPAATEFVVSPLPESIYSGDTAPDAYPTAVAGVQEAGLDKTIDIMLVPATSSKITGVEIVYYVITKDENLKAGASIVKNTITKTLATESQISLTKGTQHNLNILLGLTSVKLTAEVALWSDGGNTAIDLPKNVE